jgi:hypothetical protein
MTHLYFSQRAGLSPYPNGLPLEGITDLFVRIYDQLRQDGYFDEALDGDSTSMWINSRVPDKPLAVSIARSRTSPNSRAMLISWVDPGLLPYSGHGRHRRLGSPLRVVL